MTKSPGGQNTAAFDISVCVHVVFQSGASRFAPCRCTRTFILLQQSKVSNVVSSCPTAPSLRSTKLAKKGRGPKQNSRYLSKTRLICCCLSVPTGTDADEPRPSLLSLLLLLPPHATEYGSCPKPFSLLGCPLSWPGDSRRISRAVLLVAGPMCAKGCWISRQGERAKWCQHA